MIEDFIYVTKYYNVFREKERNKVYLTPQHTVYVFSGNRWHVITILAAFKYLFRLRTKEKDWIYLTLDEHYK